MPEADGLHALDWCVIGAYLALALGVGISMRRVSSTDRVSYFLAGRSLPWWWAGASIAATTFAADTPLAVTGIVASRGLSGNWLWLSWIGVHAAVVVVFARGWNRSGVLTDAELIGIRYSGRAAGWLRSIRAGLYGIVFNCLILGWVLRAMAKIAAPFFPWDRWFPDVVGRMDASWPSSALGGLGTPSEALTIVMLVALVGTYSALGGIRGVVLTDLIQLGLALLGGAWLAFVAWGAVGGREGLATGLASLYGPDHGLMNLLPDLSTGWPGAAAGVGALAFGAYLVVQSYSNMPADGGGYLMQRLNTTPSEDQARRASVFFLIIQYVVRVWPWFVVALAALVLIPIGGEGQAFGGAAAEVAADRELAYPVLMGLLLRPGVLGVMVVSLLAAFMSTVDTHLNWGASYIVNDILLRARPDTDERTQIRWARLAVGGFVLLAIVVSLRIQSIEQGWRWLAALGAAIGLPTAVRWFWWRVTAVGELGALAAGCATALALGIGTDLPYEIALVATSAASLVGMLVGIALGGREPDEVVERFERMVGPPGIWPDRTAGQGLGDLAATFVRWGAVVLGTLLLTAAIQRALLFAQHVVAFWLALAGILALVWGIRASGTTRAPVGSTS